MMPHIYASLQGYPCRWVRLLEDGRNLTIPELLASTDHAFGDVCNYDTMMKSLYKIRQKDSESVEDYMLRIHETVAVIRHAYPDRISNQGKNLMQDGFYHCLSLRLHDALGFAMAELPEREQVNTSFDNLYTLAKKMEVHQPSRSHRGGSDPSNAFRDKYRRCLLPVGWVATLEDEELFPPDPKVPDVEPPEFDQIEGLCVRMTQAMNKFQWEEHRCFVCSATDHFVRDCPHHKTFHAWHKEHLNSKGAGLQKKAPTPTNSPQE